MGLFTKKEEVPKIPASASLPSLPSLPSLETKPKESIKKDLPGLPSFPSNSKNENLNQEMVKSAVSEMPSPGEEEVHVEIPKSFPKVEAPKGESIIPQKPSMASSIPEPPKSLIPMSQEINPQESELPPHLPIPTSPSASPLTSAPAPAPTSPPTPAPRQNDPIFVRIDKFQAAQKSFEEIKSKVTEVELVLKKIKDVKSKEEEELKGWTEDIENLKNRLMEIDSDIFSHL